MLHSNHYQKDRAFRTERMREVEREHLAEKLTPSKPSMFSGSASHLPRRMVTFAVVVGLLVVATLLLPGMTQAHGTEEDTGIMEPFADALLDYRVGHYHFVVGHYEQAVANYLSAIEQIPSQIIEATPTYMAMYWDLGDAQQMAGHYDDALVSYQHYLELVGDEASEQAVIYVANLQDTLANDATFEVSLLSG